jgi:hypothetical protein
MSAYSIMDDELHGGNGLHGGTTTIIHDDLT